MVRGVLVVGCLSFRHELRSVMVAREATLSLLGCARAQLLPHRAYSRPSDRLHCAWCWL